MLESMLGLLDDRSLTFLLPRVGERALMAFVGRDPAGLLVMRRVLEIDCILNLYVRPEFQRRGVGSALLHHAIQEAPELVLIEAEVMATSTGPLAFYGALGFEEVRRTARTVLMHVERGSLVERTSVRLCRADG